MYRMAKRGHMTNPLTHPLRLEQELSKQLDIRGLNVMPFQYFVDLLRPFQMYPHVQYTCFVPFRCYPQARVSSLLVVSRKMTYYYFLA